jgi:S1-C subfamily serine protease
MFTKIGSALGALAFTMMVGLFGHMSYENNKVSTVPTLEQQLSNVVSIYTADGGSYCSGWVKAGEKVVVTAAHCAENPVAILYVDFGDGKPHPFHVQKMGDSNWILGPDLMTLTTNDTSVVWPAGLAVCTFKPYYGELLTLIGGPLGYDRTISYGSVSKPSRDFSNHVRIGSFANDLIQYDGQLLPGNSGGPAIDRQFGCVMGSGEMIVPAMPDFPYPYGLNYLTPISDLEKLK